MSAAKWIWITGAILLGVVINTPVGWIMTAILIGCLYDPPWTRLAMRGGSDYRQGRKITSIVLTSIMGLGSWSMMADRRTMAEADKVLADSQKTLASLEEQFPSENKNQEWEYTSDVDVMTDRPTRMACIMSRNAVRLNPPYESTRAKLCLRDSPQHGQNAFITLEKEGQILCAYTGCTVRVRFDKKKARDMAAGAPDDNSTRTVFIADRKTIEREIKQSAAVIIQLQLYQAGTQSLSFDVKGLSWPNG
ncbi:hypothetical protein [Sphingomonas colocasiae]|uniref:DUF4190 domain-containing protein n=1 Tax=Sphingomonas colocasiae TaxID=1848973 RepID=A0ABS7PR80_9SPHN|nr:hypothetical protein [Sphingomonas colocasiae]MBY8823850.1 hypothetical protein [Sphingomonas colocasiae]